MVGSDNTLELISLAQQGNQDAKTQLIEANSPLIKSVIKRFKDKGVEYDDLYQIGCIGFLKAINNFNKEFNVKFSTYCVPMVIGEIKRFMRDDGAIKVSRALKTLNLQINKYINEFMGQFQDKPSIEHLAKHFNVDEQEIVLAMDSARMPVSLYTPIEEDGDNLSIIDRIEGETDESETMIENLALKDIVKRLDERDRKIIMLRYYFDKTQSEIAKELNISQVQVSRLENKILNNLKAKLS